MLLRFTFGAAGALVLASSASAQNQTAQAQAITSPVKNAGTYHLATGTWSRGVTNAALAGPEIIYDNTCTVGFYTGVPDGSTFLDSGRIPSTSSPATGNSHTGLYDAYEVNGFSIGYCSFEPLVTSIDLSFADCFAACDGGGVLPTPLVTFNMVNMPAGTAAGGQGCWLVTVDLAGIGEFGLAGDCNGMYDNLGSTDSFSWSWTTAIPTTGSNGGPFLAGDPLNIFNASCGGYGAGTTFAGAVAGPGTGLGLLDQFETNNLPGGPGCYWFGGYGPANPLSGFYLQLEGDIDPGGPDVGTPYCFGDGTGAACPCSAFGAPGQGCANTTGMGATMTASGVPSMSTDTFQLDVVGVNGAKPGLVLRGDNQVAIPAGMGILCTSGMSQRSHVQVTAAGATTYTDFNGAPFGSVATVGVPVNFQFWYRDPAGTCNSSGFNFTNAWTVTYGL